MRETQVFLIDDDEIFRFTADILARQYGLTKALIGFENGLDGYEALMKLVSTESPLPDVILLDINMPIMNGWEFLNELSEASETIKKQIQIYILTSSIAPEDIKLSKEYPFIEGYITKPLTEEDIEKIKRNQLKN